MNGGDVTYKDLDPMAALTSFNRSPTLSSLVGMGDKCPIRSLSHKLLTCMTLSRVTLSPACVISSLRLHGPLRSEITL
ncbi:hypothetical protein J6590_010476 [Homalodisca vitripennis]|nr:hypothetical protein J6590_010476 [Homalodisca vitripennis]